MANFDQAELALKCTCPNNTILYDDKEMPSIFVKVPKFKLSSVLSTDDDSTHPTFLVDGDEKSVDYIGKFQTHHYNSRAYSLPGEDPSNSATHDTFVNCARAKGGNFHEITCAEWAAIALWCHANGLEPRGNNNYGKDVQESLYRAVPTSEDNGKTGRVATGTGPVTWSHDGTVEGIWDLNGNIWEWCTGFRLVKGEVQIIENNNAASPTCDLSATSTAWKVINASTGVLMKPNGSGTTSGSVKLDYVSGKWVYTTTITSSDDSSRSCAFKDVSIDSTIGDETKLLLQSLAMLPDTALMGDNIDAAYGNDHFWANNAADERVLVRGGDWDSGGRAGVFYVDLVVPRSGVGAHFGGAFRFVLNH